MDNNNGFSSKKVIIIGGGAAGLMAAISSSGQGFETIVFEKNKTVGKKLRITGKGRCNITNNCDIEGMIRNIPGNGNFMYSSLYNFSNHDIVDFFESHNLKTKVGEVIDQIKLEPLRDRLHMLVEKRFRGELSKCEGCRLCK